MPSVPGIPGPVSEYQLTAYHEAGHLAFGLAHGESAVWVSIVPRSETEGRVHRTWGWSDDEVAPVGPELAVWVDEVTLDARCSLAGPIAESIRYMQSKGDVRSEVARSDYIRRLWFPNPDLEHASAIGSRLHPGSGAESWLVAQIDAVVDLFLGRPQLWAAVSALAAALIEHAEYDGDHATWLYEQVMDGRSYLAVRQEFGRRVWQPHWRSQLLGAWSGGHR